MSRTVGVRVKVMDGKLSGKTLLFERPLPETWRGYRIIELGSTRIAVVDRDDPHLPLIAWRAWNLDDSEGAPRLRSLVTNKASWPVGGPLAAICTARVVYDNDEPASDADAAAYAIAHGPVPKFNCSCGIWAVRSFDDLEELGYTRSDVIGLIAGWGRLIEHEAGYRFERAYPLALVITLGDGQQSEVAIRTAMSMRRAYRVPVAVASAAAVHPLIARLVERGGLPRWTNDALPADLRGKEV